MVALQQPNILITGTPGTGKTSQCIKQCKLQNKYNNKKQQYKHYNISEIVKKHKQYDEYDKEQDTYVINTNKLHKYTKKHLQNGGCIIDHHSPEQFSKKYINLVIVLRCDTKTLYDRLQQRKYNKKKLQENIEAEIMQVCLDSAQETFTEYDKTTVSPSIKVVEQSNVSHDQIRLNCRKILQQLGYPKKKKKDACSDKMYSQEIDHVSLPVQKVKQHKKEPRIYRHSHKDSCQLDKVKR